MKQNIVFGFGLVKLTEISVSAVSVFTRFGRPLYYNHRKIYIEALNLYYMGAVLVLVALPLCITT